MKFLKNKFCITPIPVLMELNLLLTRLLIFIFVVFVAVFIIRFIVLKIKKEKIITKKIKKNIVWIVPVLIYITSSIFLKRNYYLYILSPIILTASLLISIYLTKKKDLIKFNIVLKIVSALLAIMLVALIVIFGFKTFEEFNMLESEKIEETKSDEDVIIIDDPVGECSRRIY